MLLAVDVAVKEIPECVGGREIVAEDDVVVVAEVDRERLSDKLDKLPLARAAEEVDVRETERVDFVDVLDSSKGEKLLLLSVVEKLSSDNEPLKL